MAVDNTKAGEVIFPIDKTGGLDFDNIEDGEVFALDKDRDLAVYNAQAREINMA